MQVSVSNEVPGPEAAAAEAVESVAELGWWLVDAEAQVVAGPFPTHVDAALSEVSSGVPSNAVVTAWLTLAAVWSSGRLMMMP